MAGFLLAGACDRRAEPAPTPGARLEAAALAAGIVTDPATAPITGSWGRDNQRLCIVPADGGTRIGALVDFGSGQGCAASGSVEQRGDRLRVALGRCRFEARFDGERIAFPATLPPDCEAFCTGRADLAALEVDRLSTSRSEATTLRAPSGRLLCPA